MSGREEETRQGFSKQEAQDIAHSDASGLDNSLSGMNYIHQVTADMSANRYGSMRTTTSLGLFSRHYRESGPLDKAVASQREREADTASDAKADSIEREKGAYVPIEKTGEVDLKQADGFI